MANQTFDATDVSTVVYNMAGAMGIADPFIANANKEFLDFPSNAAQVGTTIQITRPATGFAISSWDLTGNQGAIQQEIRSLTLDREISASLFSSGADYATTLVNNPKLMEAFVKSNCKALATNAAIRASEVIADCTYRGYAAGINVAGGVATIAPINDMTQIREAVNSLYYYGSEGSYDLYLDSATNNAVVNSGLSKFTLDRNNSEAQSWLIGDTENISMLRADRLHTHTAGTIGDEGLTMTLSAVSADGKTLTFTDVANAAKTVVAGDIIEFESSTLHPVTYIGKVAMSGQKLQARVTAAAVATGAGVIDVVVELDNGNGVIDPASNDHAFVNASRALVAAGAGADTAIIYPSHRVAVLAQKDCYFLGMPKLPELSPFESSSQTVEGVSLRGSQGAVFNTAQQGFRFDALVGWSFMGENCLRVMLPI